jgi:hypothetical protein
MSDTNAQALYDFANKGTLLGMLLHSYRKLLMNTDDMLPAKVISYDRSTNTAVVQPQIKMVTTNNLLVSRAAPASVPVFALGGGGFFINFPLIPGNTGWIKASDRDISLYLQSGNEAAPNTGRLHSFEDGLFLPDVMDAINISGGDANNMVIGSTNGAVKISLSTSVLNLAATNIELVSETLTHNGVNIGSTHGHQYIPGSGAPTETGPPE